MAESKATHIVVHEKLYLSVDGKLKHFPKDTEITLHPRSAVKLGKKVKKIQNKKPIDLTDKK